MELIVKGDSLENEENVRISPGQATKEKWLLSIVGCKFSQSDAGRKALRKQKKEEILRAGADRARYNESLRGMTHSYEMGKAGSERTEGHLLSRRAKGSWLVTHERSTPIEGGKKRASNYGGCG